MSLEVLYKVSNYLGFNLILYSQRTYSEQLSFFKIIETFVAKHMFYLG